MAHHHEPLYPGGGASGTEIQKSRNPEIQKTRNQEIQKSRNPEIQKSRNPEIQKSRNPETAANTAGAAKTTTPQSTP
jgi:hypothetical protein